MELKLRVAIILEIHAGLYVPKTQLAYVGQSTRNDSLLEQIKLAEPEGGILPQGAFGAFLFGFATGANE